MAGVKTEDEGDFGERTDVPGENKAEKEVWSSVKSFSDVSKHPVLDCVVTRCGCSMSRINPVGCGGKTGRVHF